MGTPLNISNEQHNHGVLTYRTHAAKQRHRSIRCGRSLMRRICHPKRIPLHGELSRIYNICTFQHSVWMVFDHTGGEVAERGNFVSVSTAESSLRQGTLQSANTRQKPTAP